MLKRTGPRIERSGIPLKISNILLIFRPNFTNCFLLVELLSRRSIEGIEKP